MTLNVVMAIILRYFSKFAYFPGVLRKSSRSLSHLLVSSCSNRVVNTWNSLPNWVVSANSTNTFKARLDQFWHNQDITYNFRAQLQGTGSRGKCLYEES